MHVSASRHMICPMPSWHVSRGGAAGIVRPTTRLRRMENELVKRVMWSGLLTAVGAVASLITQRTAAYLWRRLFDEEPPE
jgi:hypothetical protein